MEHRKKESNKKDPRRMLPSTSELLENERIRELLNENSRFMVLEALHLALDWFRKNIEKGIPAEDEIAEKTASFLEELERERLRPVVNGTGIILHTGLGRGVLPREAVEALNLMDRCSNLQIDLETGKRGKRNYMTEWLLCRITGAEGAIVVNNNAGATLLVLAALC